MRPPAFRPRCVRGFSLLEVLVAFVILALVATALFRLFSGALQNASAAEEWSRAVLVAESAARGRRDVQPLAKRANAATTTMDASSGRPA